MLSKQTSPTRCAKNLFGIRRQRELQELVDTEIGGSNPFVTRTEWNNQIFFIFVYGYAKFSILFEKEKKRYVDQLFRLEGEIKDFLTSHCMCIKKENNRFFDFFLVL